MQPETRFKNKVLPILRAIPNSWWVKVQQMSINGTPDILGVVHGIFVAWELKVDDVPTPLQQHNLDRINAAGGWGRSVTPENFEIELQYLRDLPTLISNRP